MNSVSWLQDKKDQEESSFTFDRIFYEESVQADVFDFVALPIVRGEQLIIRLCSVSCSSNFLWKRQLIKLTYAQAMASCCFRGLPRLRLKRKCWKKNFSLELMAERAERSCADAMNAINGTVLAYGQVRKVASFSNILPLIGGFVVCE